MLLTLTVSASVAVAAWALLGRYVFQHQWPWRVQEGAIHNLDLTKLALTVAGGIGAVVALTVAYRRQRDVEQGRFVERFGAAAKQLGDPAVAVRIAGVYAMAGVANESRGLRRQQCVDVLCGYLRLPYDPQIGANHQQKLVVKQRRGRVGKAIGREEEQHFDFRQNDRQVRQTIIRVIAAHLQTNAETSWSRCDFDFRGAVLEDTSFAGARFSGETTSFDGATFSGETTSFARARFNGEHTSFAGARFSSEHTRFAGARFSSEHTWFDGATFSGKETWFSAAIFSGEATWFDGARFSGKGISFAGAIFSGEYTRFGGAIFSGEYTRFDGARFSGKETRFGGATFSSEQTRFDGATFIGENTWFSATFSGKEARFDAARFSGKLTSFDGATFNGELTSFARPLAWSGVHFDWDDDLASKPTTVKPDQWPPPLYGASLSSMLRGLT
ncbi:pentapeptide repeat-containing protein [Nocardia vinacea]|uniref:Pentapeptide repeat-containing protein n=1 Tax=Nocardia vinacea TaxID=96468 RepID=A0ABZ1Z361_9NOCA|nr:pentapeptide repeat-containing protein [Nocardia vinacea]